MTLIELLIGLTLFAVLATLSIGLSIDSWQTYGTIREEATVRLALADAEDRIRSFLLSATALPAAATVMGNNYTAGPTTLIATMPSIATDGSQVVGSEDTLVVTQTPDGLLQILDPGGGTRSATSQLLLGGELSDVLFTVSPPSGQQIQTIVTLTIYASAVLPQRTILLTVTRQIVVRNLS
ncbi:hypothetical protein HY523_01145 [Candidatus Berkelbacteria bacterium]|nr:hypothetical protein [Candidatus Berkelbacteria bacterium]